MGTDTASIGLRHKLHVRKPKILVEEIANAYKADVDVLFSNPGGVIKISHFVYEGENHKEGNVRIFLPTNCKYAYYEGMNLDSEYLEDAICKAFDSRCFGGWYEIYLDWDDIYQAQIYDEVVWLNGTGFRWHPISEWFKDRCAWQGFREYKYDLTAAVREQRQHAIEDAKRFGCESILYVPDQYEGEGILDSLEMTADELEDESRSKRYFEDYWKRWGKEYTPKLEDYLTETIVMDAHIIPTFSSKKAQEKAHVEAVFDDYLHYEPKGINVKVN